jgi:hypothetical protein
MSLTPREEQILDSIKDRISRSDPGLASLLAIFTKLAVDEDMPLREDIRIPRRAPRRPGRKRWWRLRRVFGTPVGRACQRFGYQRLALALWLVISIALITTALLLNRSNSGAGCMPALTVACATPAPAQSSPDSPQTTDFSREPTG